ncbi:hypothetical protein N7466_010834 [Penicillium verhagenii]|uniref:uncharacterized protein n=1 Tax=Penicillium verhagenii TaxID=1562060 RepID=UPI0025452156|nr:uncharacterized protein N7466_010834 [Penicillium verhagenii]KAJ5917280.1 hypothetical protein N7466_010834 [Penicillium verhagenii]
MSVINSPSSIKKVDGYVAHYRSSIVGISLSLGSVATILIALRIYTYFFIVRRQGGWIILLAIFAWVRDTEYN